MPYRSKTNNFHQFKNYPAKDIDSEYYLIKQNNLVDFAPEDKEWFKKHISKKIFNELFS